MEFDYFYGPEDAEQYQFYRIPKLLITSGQNIAIKGRAQQRFVRLRSLGEEYTEEALKADLQTQAFIPEIWYEPGVGPMKDTLFKDIEFTEEFATWAQHLIDQKPMIIPNV